ncbi:hypothetical protein AUK22_01785 [bacterium CG2_30_54_10]|nr:MAG: hypothetical protein AUK22_01785 [bacterium CG2_30_54_10]
MLKGFVFFIGISRRSFVLLVGFVFFFASNSSPTQAGFGLRKETAKSLHEYWAGMLSRAVWVLQDRQDTQEFDDLARELVRFRRQESELDRTSIRDGDQVEMRNGIDHCREEMEKRSSAILVAISEVHYVGYQIATANFPGRDKATGYRLMKLAAQLAWLWKRNEIDAQRAYTIANYPETLIRSYWNNRLNDLIDFYHRFLYLRGEPVKIIRQIAPATGADSPSR